MEFMILLLTLFLGFTSSFEVTEVVVPEYADFRETATLSCTFDIGSEELYSVKWYKDEQEFLRFIPSARPTLRAFPLLGVNIVLQSTECGLTKCVVTLKQLNRPHSSGVYNCEVSLEAPTFAIAKKEAKMTVVGLPKEDPQMYGLQDIYTEGDIVTVNCTAASSDPPPVIKFYINDKQAWPQLIVAQKDSSPDIFGLVSRSVSMRMLADSKFFSPRMRLRCEAEVLSSPVRTVAHTAALKSDGTQQLRNQKLEWPSSKGGFSYEYSSVTFLVLFVYLLFSYGI